MGVDRQDYIDELLFCIRKKDMIKAKVLLDYIEHVDIETKRRLLFELSRCDDSYSVPLLVELASNVKMAASDMPELKQILLAKFLDNPESLIAILTDSGKRFDKKVFIEIAGEIQCDKAVQPLIDILKNESDKHLIVVIINALGLIASSDTTNIITDHLYSRDRKIIQAAIEALRKIATPTAVQRLAERMGTDARFDFLIIDVFAHLQTQTALEKLNNTLISHNASIRNYGKSKLIEIGEKSVPTLIHNLVQDDPDLLIHSLNVLSLIGDKSAIAPIRKLLFNEPKNPNVRFAAYEALGMLPLDREAYVLASGLADPVDNVRMAAAKAINKNYNAILSAGIKNLLSDKASDFHIIIRVVIDSEADNIFLDIIEGKLYQKYVLVYLKNKAHNDVRSHFQNLLMKKGFSELAGKLSESAPKKGAVAKKVFAVDDSRMILSVYRTILHKLGYESELFEFPATAIEALKKNKPDILLTDLNMPDITGVDLAREVRKHYSSKELPIIMVTTQNEVQDDDAAQNAGVDMILRKPFDDRSLGDAIKKALS